MTLKEKAQKEHKEEIEELKIEGIMKNLRSIDKCKDKIRECEQDIKDIEDGKKKISKDGDGFTTYSGPSMTITSSQ